MEKRDFLRLLSLLLDYPDEELYNFVKNNEIEPFGVEEIDQNIWRFLDFFRSQNLRNLQEYYVENIDFGKDTNFYLTYHRYAEDKKRGQALVEIKEVYQSCGFDIGSNELPDYLPLVLEFAALGDYYKGLEILEKYLPELEKMKKNFHEKGNPYFYLLEALSLFLQKELVKK